MVTKIYLVVSWISLYYSNCNIHVMSSLLCRGWFLRICTAMCVCVRARVCAWREIRMTSRCEKVWRHRSQLQHQQWLMRWYGRTRQLHSTIATDTPDRKWPVRVTVADKQLRGWLSHFSQAVNSLAHHYQPKHPAPWSFQLKDDVDSKTWNRLTDANPWGQLTSRLHCLTQQPASALAV